MRLRISQSPYGKDHALLPHSIFYDRKVLFRNFSEAADQIKPPAFFIFYETQVLNQGAYVSFFDFLITNISPVWLKGCIGIGLVRFIVNESADGRKFLQCFSIFEFVFRRVIEHPIAFGGFAYEVLSSVTCLCKPGFYPLHHMIFRGTD